MSKTMPIVILSTADYDAAVWTNKQHIASRLSLKGPVYYVESLGLREPTLNMSDLRRIFDKVLKRSAPKSKPATTNNYQNVKVITPVVIPLHRYWFVRQINKVLLKSVERQLPAKYVLWTFSPMTYNLERNAAFTAYHTVDLLHQLPGIPAEALLSAEADLVHRADAVIASSDGVARHIRELGREPLLWQNVADVDLFRGARSEIRQRRAVFAGNLTPSKVDFSILESIAAAGIQLILIGPTGIDGVKLDPTLQKLLSYSNVVHLGTLSQRDMAIELGKSWLGLIPYKCNSYTDGVFPMKVYEYLAAGLPVIATPLTSLKELAIEDLSVVEHQQFSDRVIELMMSDYRDPNGSYESNSWEARVTQIEKLLSFDGPADCA